MAQTPGTERTSTQNDIRLAMADSSVVMLGIAVLGLGLGIILNAHGLPIWRAPSVDCVDGVPGECAPSGVRSFIPVAQCEGFLG